MRPSKAAELYAQLCQHLRGKALERAVFDKTPGMCAACRAPLRFENRRHGQEGAWEMGHDVADARGGPYTYANLWPLCIRCNRSRETLPLLALQELWIRLRGSKRGGAPRIEELVPLSPRRPAKRRARRQS